MYFEKPIYVVITSAGCYVILHMRSVALSTVLFMLRVERLASNEVREARLFTKKTLNCGKASLTFLI